MEVEDLVPTVGGGGGGTEGEVGERKLYEEGPDFLIGSPLSTA